MRRAQSNVTRNSLAFEVLRSSLGLFWHTLGFFITFFCFDKSSRSSTQGAFCFQDEWMRYSCDHLVHAILLTLLLTPAYIYFSAFSSPENSCTLLIVQKLLGIPRQLLLNIGHGSLALNLREKNSLTNIPQYTLLSNVLTPVRVGLRRESD